MPELVIVLDNIRSMHNVGSIFRTADAAGCVKVYLCGITPGPMNKFHRPNRSLLKVALDAEKFVAWEQVQSTTELLKQLRADGYKIIAIEQHPKSRSLYDVKIKAKKKYALVLGSEIFGISQEVLALTDTIIQIPMHGKKESLNVAVAFGIVVFQLRAV